MVLLLLYTCSSYCILGSSYCILGSCYCTYNRLLLLYTVLSISITHWLCIFQYFFQTTHHSLSEQLLVKPGWYLLYTKLLLLYLLYTQLLLQYNPLLSLHYRLLLLYTDHPVDSRRSRVYRRSKVYSRRSKVYSWRSRVYRRRSQVYKSPNLDFLLISMFQYFQYLNTGISDTVSISQFFLLISMFQYFQYLNTGISGTVSKSWIFYWF